MPTTTSRTVLLDVTAAFLMQAAALVLVGVMCAGPGVAQTALTSGAAETASTPPAAPGRILIRYEPPTNPAHQQLYEMVQQRGALERLQQLFSPFQLSNDLTIVMKTCGMSNAWYQRPQLTICYEYLDDIRKMTPKETTPAGITPTDAVLGQFYYVVTHEMGHAMFDMLNVPLFGRPEDAADNFAAYMMLLTGKDDARRLIGGAAYTYKDYVNNPTVKVPITAFSDAHGAPMQRFYNLLCIAYGADQQAFGDLVEKGYLPQDRARSCRMEYGELAFAFKTLIKPHVDAERAQEMLSQQWLPPEGERMFPSTSGSASPAADSAPANAGMERP